MLFVIQVFSHLRLLIRNYATHLAVINMLTSHIQHLFPGVTFTATIIIVHKVAGSFVLMLHLTGTRIAGLARWRHQDI